MGTTTGLKPDSMYYDRETGEYYRVGTSGTGRDFVEDYPDQLVGAVTSAQSADAYSSLFEDNVPSNVEFTVDDYLKGVNVSDGISQEEMDLVVFLLDSNAVTVGDVARSTGIPASVIQSAYDSASSASAAPQQTEPARQQVQPSQNIFSGSGPSTRPSTIDTTPIGGLDLDTGEREFDSRGDIFAPPGSGSYISDFDRDLDIQDENERLDDLDEFGSGVTTGGATITPSTSDGTSLPAGVAGPVKETYAEEQARLAQERNQQTNQEMLDNAAGEATNNVDPTLLEKAQAQANKIGTLIGKAQDALFDILGIPKPDYSVIQPNAPGGTVIWGQPSGGVFGRVGVTPGGTVVGVQTGIPALDILLGKTADIISGRASAGEVLNTETIKDIVIETAAGEFGVDSNTAAEAVAGIKTAAQNAGVLLNQETGELEQTGKFGVDTAGGGEGPKDVTGGATITPSTSDGTFLPEGVAGPVKVVDTAGGEDIIDRTPTDRVVGDGFQLDSTGDDTKNVDVIDRTPTDRVVGDGFQLDSTGDDTKDVIDIIDSTPTDRVVGDGFQVTPSLTTDRTTGGGPTVDLVTSLTTDRTVSSDPTLTERAPTLTTDRLAPTLTTDRLSPTLDVDRAGGFDPTLTERAPTLTTTDRADEAPGGGSVGLGGTGVTPTGGIRGVATEQAGVADIRMLYNPSLSLAENIARILGENRNKQAGAVDSVRMYGGGIVQPTDLDDELLRIIEGR